MFVFEADKFRKPCRSINKHAAGFVVDGCPVLVFPCGAFSVLHECSLWVAWATTTLTIPTARKHTQSKKNPLKKKKKKRKETVRQG